MAKRQSASGGWQTPGTRAFFVQILWYRAPELNQSLALARIRKSIAGTRAPSRVVWEQTALAADADDNEDQMRPFTDLLVEAGDAAEVWAVLQALLADPEVGAGLRRSSFIHCDAPADRPRVSARGLLLHHFDPSHQLDEFC